MWLALASVAFAQPQLGVPLPGEPERWNDLVVSDLAPEAAVALWAGLQGASFTPEGCALALASARMLAVGRANASGEFTARFFLPAGPETAEVLQAVETDSCAVSAPRDVTWRVVSWLGSRTVGSADSTYLGAFLAGIFGSRGSLDGDGDGDGFPDLVVTAPHADAVGPTSGSVYLFTDVRAGRFAAGTDASLELTGVDAGDWAGISVSWAGDVDADGDDDLLIGARVSDQAGPGAGAAYLVRMPLTGVHSLAEADLTLLGGGPLDQLGAEVSAAKDANGDGVPDVWIGSPYSEDETGRIYLVSGDAVGVASVLDVAVADRVGEQPGDLAGMRIAALSDVSGDGLADVAVGAEGSDGAGLDAGVAYVLFGPVQGAASLADSDTVLPGRMPGDLAGSAVFGLGDHDGDGLGDLAVQARGDSTGGVTERGALYVLHPEATSLDLPRVVFLGESDFNVAGSHVVSCDVDGDGELDLLVGAQRAGMPGPESGTTYIFYGPLPGGVVLLGAADARFVGTEPEAKVGQDVSCADVDADGYADAWVGTEGSIAELGVFTGAAYLFFGRPRYELPVTRPAPSEAVETPSVEDDPGETPDEEPPVAEDPRATSKGCDAGSRGAGGFTGLAALALGAAVHRRRSQLRYDPVGLFARVL